MATQGLGRSEVLMSDDKTYGILKANKDIPFVKRILEAGKYPVKKNPDGSVSTHLMGYGEAGGKYFVYPALQYKDGKWKISHDPSDALKTKNVIWFPSEKEASVFAKGSWKPYMKATKILMEK